MNRAVSKRSQEAGVNQKKEGKNDNNYIYGLKMFRALQKVSDGLFHSVSGNICKPTYLRLANASIFKA